ncbi:hypothetical protein TNCV_293191 [Trichonephila clavipes]|nr:hypothetical protein TNCV_293191 [Trichonephila clavipes]
MFVSPSLNTGKEAIPNNSPPPFQVKIILDCAWLPGCSGGNVKEVEQWIENDTEQDIMFDPEIIADIS